MLVYVYMLRRVCFEYVRSDNEGVTLDELDSLTPEEPATQGDPDVLGYSQLGGAPLGISQQ